MKCHPKYFREFCGRKKRASSFLVSAAIVAAIILPSVAAFTPSFVEGQVAGFVFTTDPQTIEAGAVSGQMTIQAQAAGGTSVNIPQTACFSLNTTSAQGQFSSSATTWNPLTVLTMNKNTANRSFYYKDAQDGTYTLTVKVSLKPEDESRSCTNWPVGEWNIQWTATQNITVGTGSPSPGFGTSAATSTSQSTGLGNSSGDSIMPPPPKVFADGGNDRTVIVGADTEFRARAYDEKKNLIDFSRFHWNFGDGSTSEVATILHRFEYPGRYVVVLDMPEEKDAAADQIIVTVERVELVLSLMQDGGVMIENHAGRTLDLSRWIIRSLGRTFTIPDHTFVLANSPLRISPRTLGFSSGADVELVYPNGTFALSAATTQAPTSTPPVPLPAVVPRAQTWGENSGVADRIFVSEGESIPVEQSEIVASTAPVESAQAAGAAAAMAGSSRIWWLGAIGIAGFAAGSLALARRYGRKEWDIEEMSETR